MSLTSRCDALQQPQQDMNGLHEISSMRAGLVAVAEALDQTAQHGEEA